MVTMNPGQWKYTLLLALACSSAVADELTIKVKGLKEPLLSQVTDSIDTYAFSGATRLSSRRLQQTADSAKRKAVEALRPYGYYHAEVETSLAQNSASTKQIRQKQCREE